MTHSPHSPKLPPGIPYIIGNEAAERFSYYGMKCILIIYMTQYLASIDGSPDLMSAPEAKSWYHLFGMANYLFPVFGALVADIWWGKYRTIIRLSLVYCLGHLLLALLETRLGLALGLTCIAIGSGGIKPCVSAHVGDQFKKENSQLIERAFSYFYFSINFGAFISTLLTPVLLQSFGPSVAFGVPGLLMFCATFVFWLGRERFIAIPPVGWQTYRQEVLTPQGRAALWQLSRLYLLIAVFWSLFDQTGSSWVLQAQRMDRVVELPMFGPMELLPSQIQSVNPILILVLVPAFTWGVYPLIQGRFPGFAALQKIFCGLVIASLSFVIVGCAEASLQQGASVSVWWQLSAYLVLTCAEVMVSITALEFSYTQAPNAMKSLIMSLFLLSVAVGNGITAVVNMLLSNEYFSEMLAGEYYYYFFAGLMLLTAFVFFMFMQGYESQEYLHADGQGE